MDSTSANNELNLWFSTYGIITSQRVLDRYQISIPYKLLSVAIKSPTSFYHRLLQVPLRNILNGIILQQASDYELYGQKLFIDYLLSGVSSKGPEEQGALTRESLENERQDLVALAQQFQQLEFAHNTLIAESQSYLIKITNKWKQAFSAAPQAVYSYLRAKGFDQKKINIEPALNHALIYNDLTLAPGHFFAFIDSMNELLELPLTDELRAGLQEQLAELLDISLNLGGDIQKFSERAIEMNEQARAYRTQFYETIIRVTELISLLPDYKIDPTLDAANKEPLHFDKSLGTESL